MYTIKNKKVQKGFTLIELMVAVIIIGILVSIAFPKFVAAQDRAKVSSVKSNMRTLQIIAETYAVDYTVYPGNRDQLYEDGKRKGYWKEIQNPFMKVNDPITSYGPGMTTPPLPGGVIYFGKDSGSDPANTVIPPSDYTRYIIYGIDKTGKDNFIRFKNEPFYLTNS